jgi:hypothetical protein
MNYHATDVEVQLGDRVVYKHALWGSSKGMVAYLPDRVSQVEVSRFYDTSEWVVDLASGKSVFMAYGRGIDIAHKRIEFVERGDWKPQVELEAASKGPIPDECGITEQEQVEECSSDVAASRFAMNLDKAEAWAGRIFLGSIIALLALLYFSSR